MFRAIPVVHIYCRCDDEWVVFATGRFADRRVDPDLAGALEVARRLSEDTGLPLRIHDSEPRSVGSSGWSAS